MEQRFRLTNSIEIMRVRRFGKSFAHPLVILQIQKGNHSQSQFAVLAGNSVGNAVQRNRAKRLLRAALREIISGIQQGYNGVLIARKPLLNSNCIEVKEALEFLFKQAELFSNNKNG